MCELHTGTFSPERNFEEIINKLDYLEELGVNTIEIMPVARFSVERNWGYDVYILLQCKLHTVEQKVL